MSEGAPGGPRKPVDLLVRGGLVVTMDDDWNLYPQGAVAVRRGEIALVGPGQQIEAQVEAAQVIDARGCAVLPGLVNAHSHIAMTLFRGMADDMPLEPWLAAVWGVELEHATEENVRLGSRLAFAELMRGGVTTVHDMYWHYRATTEVAQQVGFRLVTGPSFIDFVGPDGIQPEAREPLAREYLERYREDPLIHPCVQAHAAYSVPRRLLELTGGLAQEYGVPFVTHLSETEAEVAQVQERTGLRPPAYFDSLGLLGPGSLFAHAVHLNEEEIALLAERGAAVAHCPESNLKLGSGVAPVPDMLQAGVTVGLGTDGAASNNDLDLLGETRTAALLHKGVCQDPTVLPARQALYMATRGSAAALGLGDRIGSLAPGKRADLITLDLSALHLTPRYDVYSHLVYAAGRSDVRDAVIQGRVVMRERELLTLDEREIRARAVEAARGFRE